MNTIYKPKGAAAEYGNYAVNIYTGCPHRCYYCFAPNVLHREREAFHSCVEPRKDIVRELRRQLEREQITGFGRYEAVRKFRPTLTSWLRRKGG